MPAAIETLGHFGKSAAAAPSTEADVRSELMPVEYISGLLVVNQRMPSWGPGRILDVAAAAPLPSHPTSQWLGVLCTYCV